MPDAERILAPADGGGMKGGAPRAVWLRVYANPRALSAQAAAERLIELGRPCHLVWNPVSGEVAQLIPAIRAGRALGWPESQGWHSGPAWLGGSGWVPDTGWRRAPLSSAAEPIAPVARDGLAAVNTEGRVCVQIAVVGQVWWPYTIGPAERLTEIVGWLDSWQVPRGWPGGRPTQFPDPGLVAGRGPVRRIAHGSVGAAGTGPGRRRDWALGGNFAAVQVPGCAASGVGHRRLDRPDHDQPRIRSAWPADSPARMAARIRQPRLTPARSAAP